VTKARENRRSVVYASSSSIYLANFRVPLMGRMRDEGWRVVCAAPEDAGTARLIDSGFEWHPIQVSRALARPWENLLLVEALTRLYREQRPELVHHFTSNPIFCGGLAARRAGVPAVVHALPGMPSVFYSTHWDAPLLRAWLRIAYRRSTRLPNSRTIFQNPDDRQIFVDRGLVPPSQAIVIRSSGVDPAIFRPRPEPQGSPIVVFCGRMLRSKGVYDLVAAARLLRQWRVDFRMHLVGPADPGHASAVSVAELEAWEREGLISWLGWRDDMPEVFAAAHIVALPSYREGVPRSLIEAAACGRALVATDVPGCREIVVHEQTGLLVPARNPDRLAEALVRLIHDPEERRALGEAGCRLATAEFAEKKVIDATLEVYRDLGVEPSAGK